MKPPYPKHYGETATVAPCGVYIRNEKGSTQGTKQQEEVRCLTCLVCLKVIVRKKQDTIRFYDLRLRKRSGGKS
jgi:hypothetical protein